MYDILIKNGLIYDGTGTAPFQGDIAVKDGKICKIGKIAETDAAFRVIDAAGLVVSPGFIDPHTHDDQEMIINRQMTAALSQGVTTEIVGLCGLGMVPCKEETKKDVLQLFSGILEYNNKTNYAWNNIDEYLAKADGSAINVAVAIPHGALRVYAGGLGSKKYEEIADAMEQALQENLDMGAVGLSIGLDYYPTHKDEITTEELEGIAKVLKRNDATMLSHIRYGGSVDGLDEMFDISRRTGAKIHVLHTKTSYPGNCGHPEELLTRFQNAIDSGSDITTEFYPYPCWGACHLTYLLPLWVVKGTVAEIMNRLTDPAQHEKVIAAMKEGYESCIEGLDAKAKFYFVKGHDEYGGRSFDEVAELRGQSVPEMLIDVLIETKLAAGFCIGNTLDPVRAKTLQDDFMKLFQAPYYGIGSDTISLGEYILPRAFGSFAKIIRLTREYGLPLETTIYKITKFVADRFNLVGRGVLAEGNFADIAIFKYNEVTDRATDDEPRNTAAGMRYVLVNGHVALRDERPNGYFAGRALRRGR